ncbi:MAG: carboxypeptidase regulatory-like domain-containing protein [Candidatus Cloacimonetes bacterium]|nr:carboxypeptidase regulatory-like domain-containing protein [Candidatus Cloacimonadota bacterium]
MLRKLCVIFIISIVVFSSSLLVAKNNDLTKKEFYFKFTINAPKKLIEVGNIISIDNVKGDTVFAYANYEQMTKFKELGYSFTELTHPGKRIDPRMASSLREARDWDYYPTYDQYISMMYQFETDYPNLCKIIDIGETVEGRDLLFARITDNINVEENEPEFMYTATMHGDETAGYVLMLRLIDYLLSNYGSDAEVTEMVNNIDIWINPLANPDGTYAGGNSSVSGATRYNANGYDLNRNFPDPEDGMNPNGPWQPETIAMMDIAEANTFVHSANFHGGAEVVNYPWDTWDLFHADDDWYFDISRAYADTVHSFAPSGYMTFMNNGITRGYVWYSINGGRQDYMNWFQACREVTLEISDTKLLPASQLDAHWNYNKRSFINYIKNVLFGIRGVVTDTSGAPLYAKITIPAHDYDNSEVYTDPDVGDYHRMLLPGTYDLEVSAYGYVTQEVNDVTVVDTGATVVNVELEEANSYDVTGVIKDGNTYDPISDAVVELIDVPVEPDTTDSTGHYELDNVLEGNYEIRISADGYPTLIEQISVSEFNHTFNFMLLPPDMFNDFEDNDGGYVSNNPNGWQWGEPGAGNINAYSGSKVWATVLDGTYQDNANWTLQAPGFDVPENAFLSFYHYYDFEGGYTLYDGGNVDISIDGGNNFNLLIPDAGYDGNISALDEDGFGGSNGSWEQVTFDLAAYSGENAVIRWKFASDYSVSDYYGWYIDDVALNHFHAVDNEPEHKLKLLQSYPNPFANETNIAFNLPQDVENPQLKIYNLKGQLVKSVYLTEAAGENAMIHWDGKDNRGNEMANGIYFYQLQSNNYKTLTKKMIKIN